MKKSAYLISLFVMGLSANAWGNKPTSTAQTSELSGTSPTEKTQIFDQAAKKRLLGKHLFSSQLISWQDFGQAIVTEKEGLFHIQGKQVPKSKGKNQKQMDDYLLMDGMITAVREHEFTFQGEIKTKNHDINNGNQCLRQGEMTFKATKNRQYWRLQEMQSPCGIHVDYIDIYYRKR